MSDNLNLEKISNYVFRPVKTTEAILDTIAPVNGYLYFTTDTQKIFLGENNEYLPLGGSNSGIFYATKTFTDEDIKNPIFNIDEIDDTDLPAENDLIINIGQNIAYNGFYRVTEILSDTQVSASYLPVGGGSGGGGNNSTAGTASIAYVFPEGPEASVLAGDNYIIEYNLIAKDSNQDDVINSGTATWRVNKVVVKEEDIYNGLNTFDVTPYLDPKKEFNEIVLNVSIDTGGSIPSTAKKIWKIKAIDLRLVWDWNYDEKYFITGDNFTLNFTPYGGVDCVAHIVFDNSYILGKTYFTKNISAKDTGSLVYSDAIPSLNYGSHTCEMYLTTTVNGEPYSTQSIKNELIFTKEGSSTILSVPFYKTTATQYDTLNIPFMVYDPDLDKCNVSFYVNDVRITGDAYGRGLQSWPYTVSQAGPVKLSIKTDNNEASKDIELIVGALDLDRDEVPGYAFSFKANNISSNKELQDWEQNGVTLSFSENFDWENGGLKFDEKNNGIIEKYICVRQGTRMIINYPLFANQDVSRQGKLFKFCFKATKCYDYEAPVLECYEERSKLGIKVDAQKALFATATNPDFITQYYENSYIELENEIWPDVADISENKKGDRFQMIWVDGIPAGVKPYTHGEKLTHLNNTYITIGSDQCDVYVYTLKVYERRLNEKEHLDNFIIDAPNTMEMLARHERNNILDINGEISYEKLVEKNPGCRAYVYDIPQMTKDKNTKINVNKYEEYLLDSKKPIKQSEDAQIYVQGTSSAAYGVAAFNIRTKFKSIQDGDGNELDGWSVNDEAIPIEIACTKVNVASCENANNVVNQEWYNNFQPYHDGHRRKTRADGKKLRDCMEFNSGVIFIKDNNTKDYFYTTDNNKSSDYILCNLFGDTDGYIDAPYYKQYAIGNMGNDKKNVEVFHDITNPLACCVEVTNNQTAEQCMTTPVDSLVWIEDDDMPYEFRYPDGNDKASDEQKTNFEEFVNWMASRNPGAATGEELPEPVEFASYTFKGYDPPGFEGKESPTGVTLKGITVDTYSTTKKKEVHVTDEEGNWVYDDEGNPVMETIVTVVPYTHDTYDYRMARMLQECEEHLVMDSVVFHYLFIQQHTMVDNVAKNTFWSTEDGKHWDLTKNYDNDTSDGNDNSGYLAFNYGIECLDKTESGDEIFNASSSTWINFIHGLKQAQKSLYKQLENKGAWNYQNYLKEFEKHQNIIPEICWITDYIRKYIRPRRLGLDDNTYLNRLEGGKKTHQRTQFETYQNFYMGSKYASGDDHNNPTASIDLRLNSDPSGQWNRTNTIPISFYIDCYSNSEIGGISHHSPHRIKRGEIYEIPVGEMLNSPTDSTCYIMEAPMVQTLSGLPPIYPGYVTVGRAGKLRSIEVGSDDNGYANHKTRSVSISMNTMLQKAELQNLPGPAEGMASPALELNNLKQLEELRINGSGFTTLILANGGIVNILYLNDLSTLKMDNLSHLISEPLLKNYTNTKDDLYYLVNNLTVSNYEPGVYYIKNLDNNEYMLAIDDFNDEAFYYKLRNIYVDENIYNTMRNLHIANCPGFDNYSYQLALKSPNLISYGLTDFNWSITSNDNQEHLSIVNNEVSGIKVLDKLLATAAPEVNTATSLIGNLFINYNCIVDEYAIYSKYAADYPNVNIEYGPITAAGLSRATRLIFKSSNEDEATIHYKVLGKANNGTIGHLISEEGPLKVAMTIPQRDNTVSNTYLFTGYWIHEYENENGEIIIQKYYRPNDFPENTIFEENAKSFDEITVPEEDIVFYPEYLIEPRKYFVRFYNYDNTILDQNGSIDYEVPYGSIYNGPIKNFLYKEHSSEDKRYKFLGWAEQPSIRNPIFIDVTNYIVTGNINFYPYFEEEDVRTNATDINYFEYDSQNGLSLKSEYLDQLQGKITIPTKYNGEVIKKIAARGFRGISKITHIYFLADSQCEIIGEYAFDNKDIEKDILKFVELPQTIKEIGNYAFQEQIALSEINLPEGLIKIGTSAFAGSAPYRYMTVNINKLPSTLTELGSSAFSAGGDNIRITELPPHLQIINSFAFSRCPNVYILNFGSDESGQYLTTISNGAFLRAGTNITVNDDIYFNSSVIMIENEPTVPAGALSKWLEFNRTPGSYIVYYKTIKNGIEVYVLEDSSDQQYDPIVFTENILYEPNKYYYYNNTIDSYILDTNITVTEGQQYYKKRQYYQRMLYVPVNWNDVPAPGESSDYYYIEKDVEAISDNLVLYTSNSAAPSANDGRKYYKENDSFISQRIYGAFRDSFLNNVTGNIYVKNTALYALLESQGFPNFGVTPQPNILS